MESTSLSYVSAILYACFVFLAKYVAATSFKGTIEYGDGDVIRYANFVPFYNHKLNHSVGETRMVNSEEECIETCTEKEHCLSVNFKTTPKANANKKYICEVLNTDKFNSYNFFVAALDFNHYSFTVSFLTVLLCSKLAAILDWDTRKQWLFLIITSWFLHLYNGC